jgi:cytochrome P450
VKQGVAVPNLFSTTDKSWHAKLRRSVSNAFALSTLIQYEPLVNRTVEDFLDQVNRRFADKSGDDGVMDLSQWFRYFAIDVIGQITYSSPHGMLQAGRDPHGIMAAMHKFLRYFSVVSFMLLG